MSLRILVRAGFVYLASLHQTNLPSLPSVQLKYHQTSKRVPNLRRMQVDHSIVETFVQGGKVSITSRVYPTLALGDDARVYLFNNGSTDIRTTKFDAWKLSGARDAAVSFLADLDAVA